MALWRDPLDELIDDLERAVPAAPSTDTELSALGRALGFRADQSELVQIQMMVQRILSGPRTPIVEPLSDSGETSRPPSNDVDPALPPKE